MTKSSKINAIIAQAEALGLKVAIEDNSGQVLDSLSLKISLNFNGNANMLESILTHEFISIHAHRVIIDGKPRAFKIAAKKYYTLGEPRAIQPTRIKYWLDMMAEDLNRYQTKIAA